MIAFSQNENEWFVKGYWPWVPLLNKSMEIGQELMGVTEWIPATVPGGVHHDLFQAGLIDNPYVDQNSLKCEWVENRWWMYRTVLRRPEYVGSKIELIFKGLDYEASIYVNQTWIGDHIGMYDQASFDLTELFHKHETLNLIVLFKHAPDEMGQIGRSSLTFTQKSRFGYKWDFSTRLVNIGIWDDVALVVHEDCSIHEMAVTTDVRNDIGVVDIRLNVGTASADCSLDELELIVEIIDSEGNQRASAMGKLDSSNGGFQTELFIEQPSLWYPNGYGEQKLYEVHIRLERLGKLLDERQIQTGIRSLRFSRNEGAPEHSLPYTVIMNDQRIYIKGVNITPLDHLYGNVTEEQYEWLIYLMKQANVNLVRVWGGGIIEKSIFYELCDRHGIMVWQDFIQSSSGVDNIPSKLPQFLQLLKTASTSAIKVKRNHVSLTIWCGGNELMSAENTPVTYDDENVALLQRLVGQLDVQRLFLPTTASGPVEYITDRKGLGHDVHGHWIYRGNPLHYEEYGENDYLFHSEFGVPGVSELKSLNKFLNVGKEQDEPVSMNNNLVWRHHGEWWDTYERDVAFFGETDDLQAFSDGSQWVQAEGLRFILEANQRRKFRNSGSIIWQFNELWPNVSCTNLVDYYGEQKMAYYWVRQAYSPLHVSFDYRKLDYVPGENFTGRIYMHANTGQGTGIVEAQIYDGAGKQLYCERVEVEWDDAQAVLVGNLAYRLPADASGIFVVRLEARDMDHRFISCNEYYFTMNRSEWYKDKHLLANSSELKVVELTDWRQASADGFSLPLLSRTYRLQNTGSAPIYFIRAEEQTGAYWMTADDAYLTLLAGEEREVTITCVEREAAVFETPVVSNGRLPDIRFRAFSESIID
ncbi:MAG: glycoside hydrolase family 2 TIM barrel-domain containing protein [Candidatus Cohnella colombiensis]|uniref:beta-mannosidase n=1 Tax=Candidatus Cohnella colombiensis TaxID=3121368 RepID=A0AA95ETU3_9BACL|nr:MAG: glycoside hydrolase family 2 TIM barrel-domain containing protein [Cohnella sp.]